MPEVMFDFCETKAFFIFLPLLATILTSENMTKVVSTGFFWTYDYSSSSFCLFNLRLASFTRDCLFEPLLHNSEGGSDPQPVAS